MNDGTLDTGNAFLAALREGVPQPMLGIRLARTPDIVRIAASSGHSVVMIDLEHSAMSVDAASQMCATAGDLGLTSLVRIPERQYGTIGPLLDGGADGIIVPRVESADEARFVTETCRFPPRGHRSQITMVPQFRMRPTSATVLNPALDAHAVVKLLIESPAGVEHADEIAAVDGVDILAVGANDLTAEYGRPGRYDDPVVREAIATVAAAAARHGKLLMLGGIGDLAMLAEFLPLGVCPLYLTGMDSDLVFTGARNRAQAVVDWHATVSGKVALDGS